MSEMRKIIGNLAATIQNLEILIGDATEAIEQLRDEERKARVPAKKEQTHTTAGQYVRSIVRTVLSGEMGSVYQDKRKDGTVRMKVAPISSQDANECIKMIHDAPDVAASYGIIKAYKHVTYNPWRGGSYTSLVVVYKK